MGRDEDTPSHNAGYEVLPGSTLRWPRWILVLVAAVAIVVVIRLVAQVDSGPAASPPARPQATAQPSGPATSTSATAGSPTSTASPVTVTEVGRQILGVTGGWELFGRGDGVVVRIQFARGRITTTTVPALRSGGPVSFVLGSYGAIVRPLDFVPGYLVPDGLPARELTTPLNDGGPAFPGPDPRHVWAPPGGDGPPRIGLVGLGDTRPRVLLPVPEGGSVMAAVPDGAGYVIIPGVGGTYDSRPDGLHRITTGTLRAVGPTTWLVRECNRRGRCRTVVVDRSSGARHILRQMASDTDGVGGRPGRISPDGRTAALTGRSGPTHAVHLRDLVTGADHALPVLIGESNFDPMGSVAWSPDGRWLFIAAANGHLTVVDVRTREVRETGISLPNLSQIAIRGPQTD